MCAAIKPEIFISYIPNGQIKAKPQIYASVIYVPHVEKATADTSRNLSKLENVPADTLRKTGNAENTRADLIRNVKNVEKIFADTSRKIGVETSTFDTCRVVKNVSAATADTFRKVATLDKTSADTFREVAVSEKISADTFLQIKKTEKVTADTLRGLREKSSADTFRKVTRPEKVSADTDIKVPHVLNFYVQNSMLNSLRKNTPRNFSAQSLINSFKDYDITLFEVTLNERTLSDTFNFKTAKEFKINDAAIGFLLDYPFSFLVEETDEQDLIYTVKGMYDIDKLLYSFIETDLHDATEICLDGEKYYGASSYVSKIAGYLGLVPNVRIEEFIPYNVVGNTNITYSDLISNLFSWTSRLPQRQINVFIRGGILHCIQRGYENSVFDISDIPHSRPITNKKLIRSMYNSPFGDTDPETENAPFTGGFSDGDQYGGFSVTFINGLLERETSWNVTTTSRSNSSTNYAYTKFGDNYYLSSKTIHNKKAGIQSIFASDGPRAIGSDNSSACEDISATFSYSEFGDEIYQTSETEINTKSEYQSGHLVSYEVTTRETYHHPLGNGFYSTVNYLDGEFQGGTISQGAPSNQVSQYTISQIRKNFSKKYASIEERYEDERSRLAAIADTSFPVRELDLLVRLTDALKWLNRKIQVTVNVDLISKVENGVPELKHIVDFTERIKLDGVEYFLVSNNVSLTPRKFVQKLQLVRWTE